MHFGYLAGKVEMRLRGWLRHLRSSHHESHGLWLLEWRPTGASAALRSAAVGCMRLLDALYFKTLA
jgi:hypothetical protein